MDIKRETYIDVPKCLSSRVKNFSKPSQVKRSLLKASVLKNSHLNMSPKTICVNNPDIINNYNFSNKNKKLSEDINNSAFDKELNDDFQSRHLESLTLSNSENIYESEERETSLPNFCVISEVIGNAHEVFSECDETVDCFKISKVPPISLKKTTDVTKIKGWRRKQFLIEKPTVVEFFSSVNDEALTDNSPPQQELKNLKNEKQAFLCDDLDKFLEEETELKIGYEVPHLYAECGIKLTNEEIFSKPNISDEDVQEVGTRYCRYIPAPNEKFDLDEVKVEDMKFEKVNQNGSNDEKPAKMMKLQVNQRHSPRLNQKLLSKDVSDVNASKNILKENKTLLNHCSTKTTKMKTKTAIKLNNGGNKIIGSDINSNSKKINLKNIKLKCKYIALVLYPGPFAPLHPIVLYHLNKVRSFKTEIDKNWASFAASAVLVKNEPRKRFVLPVQCCVKTEKKTLGKKIEKVNIKKLEKSHCESLKTDNEVKIKSLSEKTINLKPCSVVVEKLQPIDVPELYCLQHNCYNCSKCEFGKSRPVDCHSPDTKKVDLCESRNLNGSCLENVSILSKLTFEKKLAKMLAKKVRNLTGDTLKSIDCLKVAAADAVELIKLKFIRESFLAGYVSIWYLQAEIPTARSKAFLSFSQTPPVKNAVNLKSFLFDTKNLPKVITEIISKEEILDPSDYAILYCDGHVWEIYGSLNITFGKSDNKVEHVFSPEKLPELELLQTIAFAFLNVHYAKWRILDFTQEFNLLLLGSSLTGSVTFQNRFIEAMNSGTYGFLPLSNDSFGRLVGAYIDPKILPFILLGPYLLNENPKVTLVNENLLVPFMYYGEENVPVSNRLKYFINSVIQCVKKSGRVLQEFWLHDTERFDNTCFLEIITRPPGTVLDCKKITEEEENRFKSKQLSNLSSNGGVLEDLDSLKVLTIGSSDLQARHKNSITIEIEHGYSLKSLTNTMSMARATSIQSSDEIEVPGQIIVYLYFDVFELGYVTGELMGDNSVVIKHPLDKKKRLKSRSIGEWFLCIIKKRLQFIPRDLVIKWFITKHEEDLGGRRPFNKFFLGGAHVLTKKGVMYLLDVTEKKLHDFDLKKEQVFEAMKNSDVLRQVKHMRNLGKMLLPNASNPAMSEILSSAIHCINRLTNFGRQIRKKKMNLMRSRDHSIRLKESLLYSFLKALSSRKLSAMKKIKVLKSLDSTFRGLNNKIEENVESILKKFAIGSVYLNVDKSKGKRKNAKKKKIRKN